jgi:hypothetical protein
VISPDASMIAAPMVRPGRASDTSGLRHVEQDEVLAVQVDVGLELGDLLRAGDDRIGAGDEPAPRRLLAESGG